jgi:acetyl esterase/lipase
MTPLHHSPCHRLALALLLTTTATLTSLATAGPLADRLRERQAQATDASAPHRLLRDVVYGPDRLQRLDVYLPPPGQAAQGVVFMVHGGAWRWGDKAAARVVEAKVARWVPLGLAVVSVNHRLLPDTPVAQQADDIRRALAFAQQQAAAWQVPPERWVLMGHSAGAHLVALVSANPAPALALGARPWLGMVSLDSAALDVPRLMQQRHPRLYDQAFGSDPAYWQATSPLAQLVAGSPPALLVCSTLRPDQPCLSAQAYAERLHALGQRAEVLPQALSHGDINQQLGQPGAYTDAVETFMASLHPALAQALRP